MNVASLELCKELERLSGWAGDWGHIKVPFPDTHPDFREPDCAGYTLGYLLRKLPRSSKVQSEKHLWSAIHWGEKKYRESADTPEDAAAKLCIALLKEGILTKEENDKV